MQKGGTSVKAIKNLTHIHVELPPPVSVETIKVAYGLEKVKPYLQLFTNLEVA